MIRSAITICLVPEAKAGPFVYHGELEASCVQARAHGFDAVEIFPTSARDLPLHVLKGALDQHGLALAALGSGAGWVRQKLSLTDPNPEVRARARAFVLGLINFAGYMQAPVIVGSMQGRVGEGVERDQALAWLAEELRELSARAAAHSQVLLYEPLNRYETNLFNRLGDAAEFLETHQLGSVKLLADLFHMNIEEHDMGATLRRLGPRLGHVHFADSNRCAIGYGHTPIKPVAEALQDIGYQKYISAEVLPWPDSDNAARQTMEAFRRWFRS